MTGSGKHYIQKELQRMFGWVFAPRYVTYELPEYDKHNAADYHVITKEDAVKYPVKDRATTSINPDSDAPENFILKCDIENADAVIAAPEEVDSILRSMPQTTFRLVCITPGDADLRDKLLAESLSKESLKHYQRIINAEKISYDHFKTGMQERADKYANFVIGTEVKNDYTIGGVRRLTVNFEQSRRLARNVASMIKLFIANDVMANENGLPIMHSKTKTGELKGDKVPVPIDIAAEFILSNSKELAQMTELFLMVVNSVENCTTDIYDIVKNN